MSDKPTSPDLQKADVLLDQLFQMTTDMAGGQKFDFADRVDSLRQTKVQFGNPRDNLIALTPRKLHDSGLELSSIRKEQMRTEYDFYYMTITVDLRPQPGAHFQALACELDFGPKGGQEPIVQSIFPQNKWKDVLAFGGGMSLGLDGNLDWNVGIDATKLSELLSLPADVAASLDNKNAMKSYIVLKDFAYDLGRFEIAAYGEGNSECYWYIQNADLQQSLSTRFGIVFKVPKGTESITLRGVAWAEPKVSWLTANLGDMLKRLKEEFQKLLNRPEAAAQMLSRGAGEEWIITLPNK